MTKIRNSKQRKKTAKKVYAFVDATNIIYGAGDYGWRMDFEKLIKYLKERYGAKKVFYYAGLDPENKKQLRFYEKLQEFGYTFRLVPVKRFADGSKKADVDSRMTFEIMKLLPEYKTLIVMTGDGDFYWLLEYLLEIKKEVKLLAHSTSTAKELKQLMKERFISLEDIRHVLEFKKRRKK